MGLHSPDHVADAFDYISIYQSSHLQCDQIERLTVVLNNTIIFARSNLFLPIGAGSAASPLILDNAIKKYKEDIVFSFVKGLCGTTGRKILTRAAGDLGKQWSSKYPAFWYGNFTDPPVPTDEPVGWCRNFVLWVIRNETNLNLPMPTLTDARGHDNQGDFLRNRYANNDISYEDLEWVFRPGDYAFVGSRGGANWEYANSSIHTLFFIDWVGGKFDSTGGHSDFWSIGASWHGRVCIMKVRVYNHSNSFTRDRWQFENNGVDMPYYFMKWYANDGNCWVGKYKPAWRLVKR